MIGSLLLLPASLLAAQITISEVSAQREGARVAITVKGDAMIDPEATSAKLGEGRLYLFVRDARVHEANRAWKNGVSDDAEEIRAHRHRQKVELAVPLGDGGCQGPVEIEKAPGGLRALVGCEGAPRPIAARLARPKAEAKLEAKAEVKAEGKPAASPSTSPAPAEAKLAASPLAAQRLSEHDAAALRAKLALDAAETAPVSAPVPASKPADKIIAARPAAGGSAPTSTAPVAALATAFPAVEAHDKTAAVAEARASDAPGGGGGIVFAGCALLAIAGAAFFFSRGRAVRSRHIQILETASLGPKRALVVARVGDATMILGSSEAGITLLQAMPDPDAPQSQGGPGARFPADRYADRHAYHHADHHPDLAAATPLGVPVAPGTPSAPSPMPAAVAPAAVGHRAGKILVEEPGPGGASNAPSPAGWALDAYGVPAPDEEVDVADITAMADIADIADARSIGQDGLLARLFKRRKPANDALLPRFEDILEDSFEDQELRRKLALGLPGRVR